MKLYVVRHGETVWNKLHKVQGAADIPLAENGISLAEKTGEALKNVPFDLCITSPLIRARKTAELILEKQPAEVPVKVDARIQEINFGVLEGVVCMNDAREYLDSQMEKFFTDPWKFERPENGENIQDILARTKEFWDEITHDPSLQHKTILIASHGCAVRALLHNVYNDPEDFWHGFVPPNCSVNVVEVTDGKAVLLEDDRVYA
ncbi:histidine phosphatase family protein [Blautia sp. MSJ-19]|uniref:histidine phosphatase family protein n=1 Tax=Blautia sp. MSJ-19 TaxID=2841517 RepID=UPI001C0EFA89|nr:histidine phosphatase family protein [Blautia sp. MSJ-19]MBU5480073.1 histidine phosphatase family protein [Blautia sp. MSJ-19]